MPRSSGLRLALFGLAIAAALAVPAAARAAGGTCADCCKLPCIEARIWEARYMKGFYKRLAATRGLSQAQYEARENDAKQLSGAMSGIYLGANPSCAWDTPDPRDTTGWRARFRDTGFTIQEQGGIETWDFTLKVDPQTCSLTHPRGAEVLPSLTPCDGIGRATVAHEQKHIDDCSAWKRRGGGALTPAQNAQREVAGYEAEIAELEKVRREAAAPCIKESCKTSQQRFDIAARNFGTDIRLLLGLGGRKSPSGSPLARGGRGR
jgi:hypothetical protein